MVQSRTEFYQEIDQSYDEVVAQAAPPAPPPVLANVGYEGDYTPSSPGYTPLQPTPSTYAPAPSAPLPPSGTQFFADTGSGAPLFDYEQNVTTPANARESGIDIFTTTDEEVLGENFFTPPQLPEVLSPSVLEHGFFTNQAQQISWWQSELDKAIAAGDSAKYNQLLEEREMYLAWNQAALDYDTQQQDYFNRVSPLISEMRRDQPHELAGYQAAVGTPLGRQLNQFPEMTLPGFGAEREGEIFQLRRDVRRTLEEVESSYRSAEAMRFDALSADAAFARLQPDGAELSRGDLQRFRLAYEATAAGMPTALGEQWLELDGRAQFQVLNYLLGGRLRADESRKSLETLTRLLTPLYGAVTNELALRARTQEVDRATAIALLPGSLRPGGAGMPDSTLGRLGMLTAGAALGSFSNDVIGKDRQLSMATAVGGAGDLLHDLWSYVGSNRAAQLAGDLAWTVSGGKLYQIMYERAPDEKYTALDWVWKGMNVPAEVAGRNAYRWISQFPLLLELGQLGTLIMTGVGPTLMGLSKGYSVVSGEDYRFLGPEFLDPIQQLKDISTDDALQTFTAGFYQPGHGFMWSLDHLLYMLDPVPFGLGQSPTPTGLAAAALTAGDVAEREVNVQAYYDERYSQSILAPLILETVLDPWNLVGGGMLKPVKLATLEHVGAAFSRGSLAAHPEAWKAWTAFRNSDPNWHQILRFGHNADLHLQKTLGGEAAWANLLTEAGLNPKNAYHRQVIKELGLALYVRSFAYLDDAGAVPQGMARQELGTIFDEEWRSAVRQLQANELLQQGQLEQLLAVNPQEHVEQILNTINAVAFRIDDIPTQTLVNDALANIRAREQATATTPALATPPLSVPAPTPPGTPPALALPPELAALSPNLPEPALALEQQLREMPVDAPAELLKASQALPLANPNRQRLQVLSHLLQQELPTELTDLQADELLAFYRRNSPPLVFELSAAIGGDPSELENSVPVIDVVLAQLNEEHTFRQGYQSGRLASYLGQSELALYRGELSTNIGAIMDDVGLYPNIQRRMRNGQYRHGGGPEGLVSYYQLEELYELSLINGHDYLADVRRLNDADLLDFQHVNVLLRRAQAEQPISYKLYEQARALQADGKLPADLKLEQQTVESLTDELQAALDQAATQRRRTTAIEPESGPWDDGWLATHHPGQRLLPLQGEAQQAYENVGFLIQRSELVDETLDYFRRYLPELEPVKAADGRVLGYRTAGESPNGLPRFTLAALQLILGRHGVALQKDPLIGPLIRNLLDVRLSGSDELIPEHAFNLLSDLMDPDILEQLDPRALARLRQILYSAYLSGAPGVEQLPELLRRQAGLALTPKQPPIKRPTEAVRSRRKHSPTQAQQQIAEQLTQTAAALGQHEQAIATVTEEALELQRRRSELLRYVYDESEQLYYFQQADPAELDRLFPLGSRQPRLAALQQVYPDEPPEVLDIINRELASLGRAEGVGSLSGQVRLVRQKAAEFDVVQSRLLELHVAAQDERTAVTNLSRQADIAMQAKTAPTIIERISTELRAMGLEIPDAKDPGAILISPRGESAGGLTQDQIDELLVNLEELLIELPNSHRRNQMLINVNKYQTLREGIRKAHELRQAVQGRVVETKLGIGRNAPEPATSTRVIEEASSLHVFAAAHNENGAPGLGYRPFITTSGNPYTDTPHKPLKVILLATNLKTIQPHAAQLELLPAGSHLIVFDEGAKQWIESTFAAKRFDVELEPVAWQQAAPAGSTYRDGKAKTFVTDYQALHKAYDNAVFKTGVKHPDPNRRLSAQNENRNIDLTMIFHEGNRAQLMRVVKRRVKADGTIETQREAAARELAAREQYGHGHPGSDTRLPRVDQYRSVKAAYISSDEAGSKVEIVWDNAQVSPNVGRERYLSDELRSDRTRFKNFIRRDRRQAGPSGHPALADSYYFELADDIVRHTWTQTQHLPTRGGQELTLNVFTAAALTDLGTTLNDAEQYIGWLKEAGLIKEYPRSAFRKNNTFREQRVLEQLGLNFKSGTLYEWTEAGRRYTNFTRAVDPSWRKPSEVHLGLVDQMMLESGEYGEAILSLVRDVDYRAPMTSAQRIVRALPRLDERYGRFVELASELRRMTGLAERHELFENFEELVGVLGQVLDRLEIWSPEQVERAARALDKLGDPLLLQAQLEELAHLPTGGDRFLKLDQPAILARVDQLRVWREELQTELLALDELAPSMADVDLENEIYQLSGMSVGDLQKKWGDARRGELYYGETRVTGRKKPPGELTLYTPFRMPELAGSGNTYFEHIPSEIDFTEDPLFLGGRPTYTAEELADDTLRDEQGWGVHEPEELGWGGTNRELTLQDARKRVGGKIRVNERLAREANQSAFWPPEAFLQWIYRDATPGQALERPRSSGTIEWETPGGEIVRLPVNLSMTDLADEGLITIDYDGLGNAVYGPTAYGAAVFEVLEQQGRRGFIPTLDAPAFTSLAETFASEAEQAGFVRRVQGTLNRLTHDRLDWETYDEAMPTTADLIFLPLDTGPLDSLARKLPILDQAGQQLLMDEDGLRIAGRVFTPSQSMWLLRNALVEEDPDLTGWLKFTQRGMDVLMARAVLLAQKSGLEPAKGADEVIKALLGPGLDNELRREVSSRYQRIFELQTAAEEPTRGLTYFLNWYNQAGIVHPSYHVLDQLTGRIVTLFEGSRNLIHKPQRVVPSYTPLAPNWQQVLSTPALRKRFSASLDDYFRRQESQDRILLKKWSIGADGWDTEHLGKDAQRRRVADVVDMDFMAFASELLQLQQSGRNGLFSQADLYEDLRRILQGFVNLGDPLKGSSVVKLSNGMLFDALASKRDFYLYDSYGQMTLRAYNQLAEQLLRRWDSHIVPHDTLESVFSDPLIELDGGALYQDFFPLPDPVRRTFDAAALREYERFFRDTSYYFGTDEALLSANNNYLRRRMNETRAAYARNWNGFQSPATGAMVLGVKERLQTAHLASSGHVIPDWPPYGATIDDVNAVLFPKTQTEPVDLQQLSNNLRAEVAYLEGRRIGFDEKRGMNPLLKLQQGLKRELTPLWMTGVPRYHVNNFFGNMSAALLLALRGDNHTSLGKADQLVLDRFAQVGSGIEPTHWLQSGVTRAEELTLPVTALDDPEGIQEPWLMRGKYRGRPFRYGARKADQVERYWKEVIYTREFAGAYRESWTNDLELFFKTPGLNLAPELQGQLATGMGLVDLHMTLAGAGLKRGDARYAQLLAMQRSAIAGAQHRAYATTAKGLRDYRMRNSLDHVLDHIFPVHYWSTKNMIFMAGTLAQRPAIALGMSRVYDAWSRQWEGEHPSKRNKLHLFNLPEEVPFLGGRELWLRPQNWTNPALFAFMEATVDGRRTLNRTKSMGVEERIYQVMGDGLKIFWDALGYRGGPQYDFLLNLIGVANGREGAEWVDDKIENRIGLKPDVVSGIYNTLRYGMGDDGYFRPGLLPYGELETAALTTSPGQVVYEWVNQRIYGTRYSRAELNAINHKLYQYYLDGEFGQPESPEAVASLTAAMLGVAEGADDELSRRAIDDVRGERAVNAALAWAGLPVTNYMPYINTSYEAEQHFFDMLDQADIMTYSLNAEQGKRRQIEALNGVIREAQAKHDEAIASGVPPAEAEAAYHAIVTAQWERAAELDLPVLTSHGEEAAWEWLETEAPYLKGWWRINDNQELLSQAVERSFTNQAYTRAQHDTNAYYDNRAFARAAVRPYYDQLGRLDDEYQTRLALAGGNKFLVAELTSTYQKDKAAVFAAMDAAGVSPPSTQLPSHGETWYRQNRPNRTSGFDIVDGELVAIETTPADLRNNPQYYLDLAQNDALGAIDRAETQAAQRAWLIAQAVGLAGLDDYIDGRVNPEFADPEDPERLDRAQYNRELPRRAREAQAIAAELFRQYAKDFASDPRGPYLDIGGGLPTAAEILATVADDAEQQARDAEYQALTRYKDAYYGLAWDEAVTLGGVRYSKDELREYIIATFGGDALYRAPKAVGDYEQLLLRGTLPESTLAVTENPNDVLYIEEGRYVVRNWFFSELSGGQQAQVQEEHPEWFVTSEDAEGQPHSTFDVKLMTPDEVFEIRELYHLALPTEATRREGSYERLSGDTGRAERLNYAKAVERAEAIYWDESFLEAGQQGRWQEFQSFLDNNAQMEGSVQDLRRQQPQSDGQPKSYRRLREEAFLAGDTELVAYIDARLWMFDKTGMGELYQLRNQWLMETPQGRLLQQDDPQFVVHDYQTPRHYELRNVYEEMTFLSEPQQGQWAIWTGWENEHRDALAELNFIRNTNELTWRETAAQAYAIGRDDLGQVAEQRNQLYRELEIGDIYDARKNWLTNTPEGRELLSYDAELRAFVLESDVQAGPTTDARYASNYRGSGAGGGRSTGRSFQGGGSNSGYDQTGGFTTGVSSYFYSLDAGLTDSSLPDFQQRSSYARLASGVIGNLLAYFSLLPEEQAGPLIAVLWGQVGTLLGPSPTLDSWQRLLRWLDLNPDAALTEELPTSLQGVGENALSAPAAVADQGLTGPVGSNAANYPGGPPQPGVPSGPNDLAPAYLTGVGY